MCPGHLTWHFNDKFSERCGDSSSHPRSVPKHRQPISAFYHNHDNIPSNKSKIHQNISSNIKEKQQPKDDEENEMLNR